MSSRPYPKPPFPDQGLQPPGLKKMEPRPRYETPRYRAAGKLEGDVALITGGDSGIGRAVAVLFAREGADVAIVHLPEEEPDAIETIRAIEAEGRRGLRIAGDLKDSAFCREAVERCVGELGKLDILVNNAAYQKHRASLDELDEDQWHLTFDTNVHACFAMVKAARPHLKRGARILQTGPIVVAPGPVWTPLNPAERDPGDVKDFGADLPLGRPAQPEEIAPAYVDFASNADSGFVTGEVLAILGGKTRAG